jgi:tetratricopeptide (TPR) repeat protein
MEISFFYKLYLVNFIIFTSFGCLNGQDKQGLDSVNSSENFILQDAKKLRYNNPGSAIDILIQAKNESIEKGDIARAINALLEMSSVHGNLANYTQSYNNLWDALIFVDGIKDEALRSKIYIQLGRFYSFYKRKDEACKYLQAALNINKDLIKKGLLKDDELVQNYYAFTSTYREFDEEELSRKYLDSSYLYFKNETSPIEKAYLDFEKAYIFIKNNKYNEALTILGIIEPWLQNNEPGYLVLVYTYWGDLYQGLSNYNQSTMYYNKALEISKQFNSHLDFTPLIYERLSGLYLDKGDYVNAFNNQKIAKNLDAQFFDSRSKNNRPLLEIKDEFRIEKERQENLIQKQKMAQLEQEDRILLLQRVILIGVVIFLSVIGFLYFVYLRTKHSAEKQLMRRNKELEIQKTEELLELKNKELATSALQLVEKDEFLRDLKSKLEGDKDALKTKEINQVLNSISVSNNNNWDEFKLRFTAINDKFYQKLTRDYPNLSQSDLKICALIKLNFSSKDMARLLGISVESVHTTRYRLRKKMNLSREINLEKFISII